MKRLHARLEKLEKVAEGSKIDWDYSKVANRARGKLSSEDLELLDQALALIRRGHRSEWTEAHTAVWGRWDDALDRAAEELPFTLHLSADDMLL